MEQGFQLHRSGLGLRDLENVVHARQFQDLLNRWLWIKQVDRSFPAARRFVQRN